MASGKTVKTKQRRANAILNIVTEQTHKGKSWCSRAEQEKVFNKTQKNFQNWFLGIYKKFFSLSLVGRFKEAEVDLNLEKNFLSQVLDNLIFDGRETVSWQHLRINMKRKNSPSQKAEN